MAVKRDDRDAALVRDCLAGRPDAWDALIRRYRRLIYSIPVAFRLDPDSTDEVFQRVAVKLFEHLPRVRRTASLASWLAVTARRECYAVARRRGRFHSLDSDEIEPPASDPPQLARDLHRVRCEHALSLALERLADPCRGLIRALYVEQPRPSYEEIAQRLGRPIGSLGPTRSRCLAKLRKLYRECGGERPWDAPEDA